MKNDSSNLPDSSLPKGPTHIESCGHYSRNSQIYTCNWKILKICEENQEDAAKCYKLQLLATVLAKLKEVAFHASQMPHQNPLTTTQQSK